MNKIIFYLLFFALCISTKKANAAFVIKQTDASHIYNAKKNNDFLRTESTFNNLKTQIIQNSITTNNPEDTHEKNKLVTWAFIAILGLIFGGVGLVFCLFIPSLWFTLLPFFCGLLFAFGWGYLTGAAMGIYLGKKGELNTENVHIKA